MFNFFFSPQRKPLPRQSKGKSGSSAAAHERELREGWKSHVDLVIHRCRWCGLQERVSRFLQVGCQGSVLTAATQVNRVTVISAACMPQISAVMPGKSFLHVKVFPWKLIPEVTFSSQLRDVQGDPARPWLSIPLGGKGWKKPSALLQHKRIARSVKNNKN